MSARILNAPNIISLTRLVLSFVLFAMISLTDWWIASACLFVFAVATDAVDGYIARKYNLITVFGRILDPMVDKVIVCGSFLFLQNVPGSGVTPWISLVIVLRELYITSLRGFYEQQGIDFSASSSGKWKMVVQCVAVTFCLLSLDPGLASHHLLIQGRDLCLLLTVLITVYSGYDYTRRGVKLYSEMKNQPPTA